MDTFSKYDNLLGLFVGNEIISQETHSLAAPFIKAAVRDTKAHLKARGYRDIPIGYSAADIAELRPMLQDYLTCGGNASENIDFFALNSYEWCDPSTYGTSGYTTLNEQAKDFPVPIFFSETGCNVPGPRLFEDQAAIFGPEMVSDWSGAMIYEWIEEANHYGLISYGPKVDPTVTGPNIDGGFTRKGEPTPVTPDFDNLKKQWAKITPTGISRSDYDPKHVSTRVCPSATGGGWLVDGNVPLPTVGAKLDTEPSRSSSSNPSGSDPSSDSNTGTPASGAVEPTTSPDNAVSGSREFTGMTEALLSVMLVFTCKLCWRCPASYPFLGLGKHLGRKFLADLCSSQSGCERRRGRAFSCFCCCFCQRLLGITSSSTPSLPLDRIYWAWVLSPFHTFLGRRRAGRCFGDGLATYAGWTET